VIAEMVTEFHELAKRGRVTTRPYVHPGLFGCVHGLHAHAHALAQAAGPLWDNPTTQIACLPLARAAFECGVLAQWLLREPLALGALVSEDQRQTRNLARDWANVPQLAPYAPTIARRLGDHHSDLAPIARSMEKLCNQFVGGGTLYAFYRLMSGYTHAGLAAASQWLEPTESEDAIAPFRLRTAREPTRADAIFFGWGLLFTASAFADLTKNDGTQDNNQLNRWARRIGVDRRLTLLPKSDRA